MKTHPVAIAVVVIVGLAGVVMYRPYALRHFNGFTGGDLNEPAPMLSSVESAGGSDSAPAGGSSMAESATSTRSRDVTDSDARVLPGAGTAAPPAQTDSNVTNDNATPVVGRSRPDAPKRAILHAKASAERSEHGNSSGTISGSADASSVAGSSSTASAASASASAPGTAASRFPLDRFLSDLGLGNMVFRRPPSMVRGETKTVNLLVSQTVSIPELMQAVQAKGDVVEGHAIRIAPMMQAHLAGGAFEITPITAEEQPISGTETTEWKWEIKPKQFGKLPLHLAVNAMVTLDGREVTRTLRTFDETVVVNVSWTQSALAFVDEHIEWVLTGVLVPLVGWLVARWRKMKRTRGKAPKPRSRPLPSLSAPRPFWRFGRPH